VTKTPTFEDWADPRPARAALRSTEDAANAVLKRVQGDARGLYAAAAAAVEAVPRTGGRAAYAAVARATGAIWQADARARGTGAEARRAAQTAQGWLAAAARTEAARPLVYIAAPYTGDIEANTARATALGQLALAAGATPLVPHLAVPPLTGAERGPNAAAIRTQAMSVCTDLVAHVANAGGHLWFCAPATGASLGMLTELATWDKHQRANASSTTKRVWTITPTSLRMLAGDTSWFTRFAGPGAVVLAKMWLTQNVTLFGLDAPA